MKIQVLQEKMKEHKIDATVLNNPGHVAYLTGFSSDPHERLQLLIVLQDEVYFFAPMLDVAKAQKVTGLDVVGYLDHENPWAILQKLLSDVYKSIATVAIERNYLTVERFDEVVKLFPNATFDMDAMPLINEMMIVKSQDEIDKMMIAGKFADDALKIGFQTLRVSVSELEVVAEIEYQLKKKGIEEMSFGTLVLFGDHAADPHGSPSDRQLKAGELVLFDLGVISNGYCSDVTRTVAFGEVSDHQKEIYEIVLDANQSAMAYIKAGVKAEDVDQVARDVISDAGYGEYFIHRLGHGIGSTVHEFPSIMEGNKMEIIDGMCFSVEPGIYIEGDVGVRVEDCGYVDDHGFHSFTQTPKTFTVIDVK